MLAVGVSSSPNRRRHLRAIEDSDYSNNAVRRYLVPFTTKVRFSWIEPDTNGAIILAYELVIQNSAGDYIEYPALCDGSDPYVRQQLYCDIQMSDIEAATGLSIGSPILAKIRAEN